jgi:hypothetical protein
VTLRTLEIPHTTDSYDGGIDTSQHTNEILKISMLTVSLSNLLKQVLKLL